MVKQHDSDIKFCVTSFTDLLGFSNHLEIGNDLRTKIGQEVINRLNFLESAIDKFLIEKKKYSKYYPSNIKYKRINDSLILTIDLPEFLIPRIGETLKESISTKEMESFMTNQDLDTFEDFEVAYKEKITHSILELTQFLGLVARLHSYINRQESDSYFPGAKTVIASGYRKSFITSSKEEDYFSANFSFSNAYLAESVLKGQKLFVDNNVLRLLSFNEYTNNILKIASFIHEYDGFDPFGDDPVSIDRERKYKKGNSFELNLFRKNYLFREINPQPLAFLQLFPMFLPYLKGDKKLKSFGEKRNHYREIYNHFINKIKTVDIVGNSKFFFFFRFNIEDNIDSIKKLVLTGPSSKIKKK